MSERAFQSFLLGLIAGCALVAALYLHGIWVDLGTIRQSLNRPAIPQAEVEAYGRLRRAYAEWERVRDKADTSEEYYWGTVNFLCALKAFHPQEAADRPAITDADRHSIGEAKKP